RSTVSVQETLETKRVGAFISVVNGGVLGLARHWLLLANAFLSVFVTLPYLAPYLMAQGYTVPAQAIYTVYRLVCHQLWQRHYWLFGYPAAIDHRLTALYGSLLVGGLLFALVRRRLQPLNWRLYLLIAIVPMALDGLTQLFGFRESNWLLRTITGALFGLASVWLLYPHLERSMRDIQSEMEKGG
ncbi:MAG: DUF2085 domain-containing protein, partial [Anaerolineae bacterium]